MNLIKEINRLKKEQGALILAHYYQRPEIQDIADYVGDSYYLSKIAKDSPNNLIIFCGVKFMAESAKILSPNKKVLLPALDAGCPMADMANVDKLLEMKRQYPDHTVVTYINSSTEVKALSDVIVTSSNAEKIISNLDSDKILFLPDKNLGRHIANKFPNKEFVLWPGFCITHKKVQPEWISSSKEKLDDVVVLAHPECEENVLELADFIGSTGEIINYATNSDKKNFLIVTEEGVIHPLKLKNPNKNFYVPGTTMTCINMKKTRLEDVYDALSKGTYEIIIDEDIREKAAKALNKMHELAK
ncbi:Quinolinate synthase A [Clostridium bornimense]|uniref:Quinolinate synthase n=1 Tax=Clostridium bornimense TaxID=1216932 RepID=W6S5U5_9CLOT|nr:quinolinate synthase NadA [Clostridium bornimense]CDM69722.1 Quinolinate synthase A [Clostridium bornimense]